MQPLRLKFGAMETFLILTTANFLRRLPPTCSIETMVLHCFSRQKQTCKYGPRYLAGTQAIRQIIAWELCTGTSALYQAGVPEKVIQERTGHLFLNGLPHYECTTDYQHHTASQILSSSVATTFDKDFLLQVSRAAWRVGCTSVSPML